MQSAGSTFDSEVWAKSGMVGPLFGKETYTSVVVRAKDAATAVKLKDYFTNRYKTAAMQAQVETDYFAASAAPASSSSTASPWWPPSWPSAASSAS